MRSRAEKNDRYHDAAVPDGRIRCARGVADVHGNVSVAPRFSTYDGDGTLLNDREWENEFSEGLCAVKWTGCGGISTARGTRPGGKRGSEGMRNFKLTLCYDGTRYRGWQKQGNTDNTVQAKLEALLSRMLLQAVEAAGSGRTDAGVHAKMQVCSFRADTDRPCEELLEEIRRYLPEDIGAVSLEDAAPRFHARLSCKGKTYVYRIWREKTPDVFMRRYRYAFSEPLDVPAMRRAAALLLGKHDFSAFTANKRGSKSAVRELRAIDITEENGEMRLTFSGDGFLYNMVRILTGTLLETGLGRIPPERIPLIIEGQKRADAGFTAPPHGLTLEKVEY